MRDRNTRSMSEYISRLASTYDVFTGEFVDALNAARKAGKSSCGGLSILCRSKTKTKNTFLIMKGSAVAAQFMVPTDFLVSAEGSLANFADYSKKARSSAAKEAKPLPPSCIKEIKAGMKNINLRAEVLEVTTPRQVHTRYGTIAVLTKALVGDETGKVQLCLWNSQAENVSVGETIVIENARASKFRGKTQLSLMPGSGLCRESSLPMVALVPSELQT